MTRAASVSVQPASTSNPTLYDDWENVNTINLNGGGCIDSPWYDGGTDTPNIPWSYCTDIKKADGWKMLLHTIIDSGYAGHNRMLFYNEKTGTFKGFYYNRAQIQNQSLLWTMKSAAPTSIFLRNQFTQEPLNTTNQMVTTSNIVKTSRHQFNPLNPGWNAFSFEFPYGSTYKSPTIDLFGAHVSVSEINLNGNYSGEVIIPFPTGSSQSLLSSVLSAVTSIASGISGFGFVSSAFSSLVWDIDTALSLMGTLFGSRTWLVKRGSGVVNIKATSSGNIALNGNSVTENEGTIPLLLFDIRNLNGNRDIGVWNMATTPRFTVKKVGQMYPLNPEPCDTCFANAGPVKNFTDSDIVMNPDLASSIRRVNITGYNLFVQGSPDFASGLNLDGTKISNECYLTDLGFTAPNYGGHTTIPGREPLYAYSLANNFPNLKVNITVEIEYNDGTMVTSSRNFDTDVTLEDNRAQFMSQNRQYSVIFLN